MLLQSACLYGFVGGFELCPCGFDFEPRPHWEIGVELGLFDLAAGAKIAAEKRGLSFENVTTQTGQDNQGGAIDDRGGEIAPTHPCRVRWIVGERGLPLAAAQLVERGVARDPEEPPPRRTAARR